jgi:dTMP kinase
MIEGLFVVLEGVDGAGTTTHTRLLINALKERGLPVHSTREPSDGPIGVQIRQILTGRLVVPGLHGPRPPSWTTMALLFAADRVDHIESSIIPNLMDGVTVISDRYYHSSVAYQSVTAGGDDETIAWVKEINKHARKPDLTIVLDISAEASAKRRVDRGGGREMFDDNDLQRQIGAFYDRIDAHFPGENLVHVDSSRSVADVHHDIMVHVRRLRGEKV